MEHRESLIKLAQEILKEFGVSPEPAEKRFTPPTQEDVLLYFRQNGYKEEAARKAWKYYEPKWVDSKGNKIKNWKQKMIGVWFTEDNKAPVIKPVDESNKW